MNSQYRCETCKFADNNDESNKIFGLKYCSKCDLTIEPIFIDQICLTGCASHSDFQNQKEKVWIVAESRFEWYEIKHICGSKEIALKRWEELRDELIKEYQDMVEYCIKENYNDADNWRKEISTLKNLSPGESCDCDYPDLKEWRVELQQGEQE